MSRDQFFYETFNSIVSAFNVIGLNTAPIDGIATRTAVPETQKHNRTIINTGLVATMIFFIELDP